MLKPCVVLLGTHKNGYNRDPRLSYKPPSPASGHEFVKESKRLCELSPR